MKLKIQKINRLVVASLCLLLLTGFGEINAQPNSIKEITNQQYALENLFDGIKSNNNGVKRSSIYFVGKYRISEAEELLIEQLESEPNPSNRILIALVLYKLGSNDGLEAVKNLAAKDNNIKVRIMSTHIYNEYLTKDFGKNLPLGFSSLN